MRENGYYWVRFKGADKWDIAQFNGSDWYFTGYEIECSESEVLESYEIGEKVERKEKR